MRVMHLLVQDDPVVDRVMYTVQPGFIKVKVVYKYKYNGL